MESKEIIEKTVELINDVLTTEERLEFLTKIIKGLESDEQIDLFDAVTRNISDAGFYTNDEYDFVSDKYESLKNDLEFQTENNKALEKDLNKLEKDLEKSKNNLYFVEKQLEKLEKEKEEFDEFKRLNNITNLYDQERFELLLKAYKFYNLEEIQKLFSWKPGYGIKKENRR